MGSSYSMSGRLCYCEWSGAVSVDMVASLLTLLKRAHEREQIALVLLVRLDAAAARTIIRPTCPFLDVLPFIGATCEELVIAADAAEGAVAQLRRALCGSAATPISPGSRHIHLTATLEHAFQLLERFAALDALDLQIRMTRRSKEE